MKRILASSCKGKKQQSVKASVDWSYFDRFDRANDEYLPSTGEGNNMATQVCTAVTKLVYKWYNDGDVFDNSYGLEGWANDLSSYANWLYKYVPQTRSILSSIVDIFSESEYENLLKDLADTTLDLEDLEKLSVKPKQGSVYDCDGPFKFSEYEEEEDDYYDEDYDEDYEDDY